MQDEQFNAIMQFAIDREDEAATFYNNLQNMVKLENSKSVLKDLEMMEIGHKRLLQNFKKGDVIGYKPIKITNLKISDLMVEITPHSELNYQEALILAIKREESSNKLYTALAHEADDDPVKRIFMKLADEEAKHKLQLETIYDEEILTEN